MNGNICKFKKLEQVQCSDEINESFICSNHNDIYNIWLGAGSALIGIQENMTDEKMHKSFLLDTNTINFEFNVDMNTSELHNEYVKCFTNRVLNSI